MDIHDCFLFFSLIEKKEKNATQVTQFRHAFQFYYYICTPAIIILGKYLGM